MRHVDYCHLSVAETRSDMKLLPTIKLFGSGFVARDWVCWEYHQQNMTLGVRTLIKSSQIDRVPNVRHVV